MFHGTMGESLHMRQGTLWGSCMLMAINFHCIID